MASIESQASSLVATAAKIAELKSAYEEASLLNASKPSLVQTGHDDWNGGLDLYTLMLEIPITLYAEIEERRSKLEQKVLGRIEQLTRGYGGVSISEVVISPVLIDRDRPLSVVDSSDQIRGPDIASEIIPSYWQPGHFRLFISHASEKRESAHRLKDALSAFQIAAFVAHDDIEPTKEWQAEIETALRTMDALTAIISANFSLSKWCDQEVGMAIGRGKLVVPLRVGADPHGFLGKYQGLQAKGSNATAIARQLFEILLRHDLTSARLTDALVDRLVTSSSWSRSKLTMSLLALSRNLSTTQSGRLLRAIDENPEVGEATGVPEQIQALVARLAPLNAI
ncbi:MAG: toll/interleukin-1 receptor domain-containing protein [Burkholderiales bacterium]